MTALFSHEPAGYVCPFCEWLGGKDTQYKQKNDIIYQTNDVTAFISPKWWVNNPGHVIIIPNQHYESLYVIPNDRLAQVYEAVKLTAIAIRSTYENCTGTSTRQHNEPAGNQDVWHFHTHVFPRYEGDDLYQNHDKNSLFRQKIGCRTPTSCALTSQQTLCNLL